ncbi:DNA polymerase III subunit epsilon [Criblamydia sequanensis CRIB-18]|uniref:DNA polymerase III subunit epsilon n=2 Tax=Candidatus Criblamydia sequanensis TaxID=340071 RepID=A0A090D1S0_9BACT|nr:DNA polymerase III subunit epsilon [Criblamydia sequanensis CRIB-18]
MKMRPIIYDTETTGVKAEFDRIIEIAAFDPHRNQSFVRFINPGIPIPKEATAIHHITDDMVKEAAPFSIVAKEFIEFCGSDSILVAHNNDGFDIHFLRQEAKRHEITLPEWKFVDTLKWARKYRPDLPRHSLQFLREIYDIPANNAHRALDDCIVLHEVFKRMTDDLPIETIFQLMSSSSESVSLKQVTHMPFGKHQGIPLKEVPKSYLKWLKESGALDKEENASLKLSLESITAG